MGAAASADSRRRTCLLAALVALVAADARPAVPPPASDLAARTYRHPDLAIANVYQPLGRMPETLQGTLGGELQALGVAPQGAYYDVRGGRWGTLVLRRPILPGNGRGNSMSWRGAAPAKTALKQAAWEGFAAFLRANQALLDLDPAEMQARVTLHERGRVIQIHAARVHHSILVRGAYVTAVLNGGNLVLTGARNW